MSDYNFERKGDKIREIIAVILIAVLALWLLSLIALRGGLKKIRKWMRKRKQKKSV